MSDVEVVLRDLNRLSLFCRIVVLMRRCYFRENWEKTPHATPKCVTRPRVLRCEREAFLQLPVPVLLPLRVGECTRRIVLHFDDYYQNGAR